MANNFLRGCLYRHLTVLVFDILFRAIELKLILDGWPLTYSRIGWVSECLYRSDHSGCDFLWKNHKIEKYSKNTQKTLTLCNFIGRRARFFVLLFLFACCKWIRHLGIADGPWSTVTLKSHFIISLNLFTITVVYQFKAPVFEFSK